MKDPDEHHPDRDGEPHVYPRGTRERQKPTDEEEGLPKVTYLHSTQLSQRSDGLEKPSKRYRRYGIMRLHDIRPTHRN